MTVEVTQEDREAYLAMNMLPEFDAADVRAGLWDKVTGLQAFARHRIEATRAALADMPTIWEDPAGKGYPCFERPMTPAEARETVERYVRRIVELEGQVARLQEALEARVNALRFGSVEDEGRADELICAALQHKEPKP